MRRRRLLAAAAAGAALPGGARPLLARGAGPTVFAAASLTDAMRALGEAWQARGNPAPRFAFAASSALARQIEQGAPADLFASADEAWMDYLQERGLILDASRSSPLANSLVLIAPAGRPGPPVVLAPGTDLLALLGPAGRLAAGDPAHVPAGRYARAALAWMGQWEALAPRLARADNVRAALLLVERGEAPLGIVYATDAAAAPGVRVVAAFPPDSHPPATCPMALTRRGAATGLARDFLGFVTGAEAAATWRRLGFAWRAG